MVKHLTDLLTSPTLQAAADDRRVEDAVFDEIKDKFPLLVFTCVRLASKLCLHKDVSSVTSALNNFQSPAIKSK